jgi:hypothetical protein
MLTATPEAEPASKPAYLSRVAAAAYIRENYALRCSPKTLGKYASQGGGPYYRKRRRAVIYDKADLDAWAQEHLSRPVRTAAELDAAPSA